MSLESDPPDADARPLVSSFNGERSDVVSAPGASLPASGEPPAPRGRYVEGGELGRGGMGRVRAAYDAVLGRTLALKRVKDTSRVAEARLLDEARITASLDHPGIITVLDVGRGEDGSLYYVMRVVEGASFREVVREPRPASERVRLVLSVAQAMAYAHERGVVHRDLSAGNVRVGKHGEVVVMDWGLAAPLTDAARGGTRCGTPGFTAPELVEGAPSGPPADVFSLGVLLHLALTQVIPTERPTRPSTVPAELWSIIARCLAPDPTRRYPTAQGLERDLRAWLDGAKVLAHRDRAWTPMVRLSRRHPATLVVGSAAALLLAVVTTTLGLGAAQSRRTAEAATSDLLSHGIDAALLEDDLDAATTSARALATLKPRSPIVAGALAALARKPSVSSRPWQPDCELLDVLDGQTLCRRDLPQGIEHARLLASGTRVLFGEHGVSLGAPTGVVTGVTPLEGGLQTVARSADGRFVVATLVTTVVFADDDGVRVVEACPASSPGRFAIPGPSVGHALVMCADTPTVLTPGGEARSLPRGTRGAFRGAALDDSTFVVGTVQGELAVLDRSTGAVKRTARSIVGPVRDLVALNETVVAVWGRGGLGFWRSDLDDWLSVEPSPPLELRRFGDRVLSRDASGWRGWTVEGSSFHRARFETGLTSVAMDASGQRVAVGGADSVVRVLHLGTGALRELRRDQQGVVSHVVFSPSGRRVAFGTAGPFGVDVVDLETGARLEGTWRQEAHRTRLVGFVGDDELMTVDYGLGVRRFSLATGAQVGADVQLPSSNSVSLAFAKGRLVVLMKDGAVLEVAGDAVNQLASAPGATAIALDDAGALLLAFPTHLERRSTDGLERRELPGSPVTAIASSGGRWAVTRVDGRLEVATPAGLSLSVLAHHTRAAALSFEANTLVTAGWDGVVRVFDVPREE